MAKTTKSKVDKSAILISLLAIAVAVVIATVFIVNALNGNGYQSDDNTLTIDYAEEDFEDALNADQDVVGKTVKFKVASVHPDSACGYNLWAGVHLNFCSDKNMNISKGQEVVVKVVDVTNSLGSYIIRYELVEKIGD